MNGKHGHGNPDPYRDEMKAWTAAKAKWYADNASAVRAIWAGLSDGQRAAFIQNGTNGDNWVSNSAVQQGSPPTFGPAAIPEKIDPWASGSYTDADNAAVFAAMAKIEAAKPPRPHRS